MGLNAYLVYHLYPWQKSMLKESRRVADMLSLLPATVNIEALVAEALGRR